MNEKLLKVLVQSHAPCPGFAGTCSSMRWIPEAGHVPRGFSGATGSLEEVRLVMVMAEPGDPHPDERHAGTPQQSLESVYAHVQASLRTGRDAFHKNLRHVLNLCWPDLDLEAQLRRTWITDSVLCSADVECGPVVASIGQECRKRYLEPQIALFPNAVVAAFGTKAQVRMKGIPGVLAVGALAPPGANQRSVRESWATVAEAVQRKAACSAG